ncbi:MAG: metal ABC transporter ATP-binding protein [Spirochaetaceae bacterium]|nr:metal ABC transporter ATP-binding protein [Spirochaetaceae bacterium]
MAEPLLECHDLSFGYDGRTVLEGLTFSLNRGEKLCVVGENGSGKSTLLKGLLGLQAPMGGSLIKSSGLKRGDIGYLPQESPLQKDFPAAVFEVILSGRQNRRGMRPFYTREDKAAAAESLEMLDLADLGRRCFRELSGGQRRRVLLARSLCAAGKLLLLDEPASGLDPVVQAGLYRVLEKINAELGMAIIMVSHDIEGVLQFTAPEKDGRAGKVLHLAGRQLFAGSAEAYRESDPGKLFLGGHRYCRPRQQKTGS